MKNIKINVDENFVNIVSNDNIINKGEYNATRCEFTFTDSFNNLTNMALFSVDYLDKPILTDIVNNECEIPYEVLKDSFNFITIGVYGYDVDSENNLILRYSPSPCKIFITDGSYQDDVNTPEIITPSQYEIFSNTLQNSLKEVDAVLDNINKTNEEIKKYGEHAKEQGDYAKEQGDYAKEQGNYLNNKLTELNNAINKVEELKKAIDEIIETNSKYNYLILERESE